MEKNIQTVLFDWGDTLMVDFSNECGKMCDWETVEAVEGAGEVLHALAKEYTLCVATNAQDSSRREIEKAFQRVGLDKYISHYFCFENLGVSKVSPQFFPKILEQLNSDAQNVIMVGNEYHKDIEPAVNAGIAAIHLSEKSPVENKSYIQIERLVQLKDMLLVTA